MPLHRCDIFMHLPLLTQGNSSGSQAAKNDRKFLVQKSIYCENINALSPHSFEIFFSSIQKLFAYILYVNNKNMFHLTYDNYSRRRRPGNRALRHTSCDKECTFEELRNKRIGLFDTVPLLLKNKIPKSG